LTDYFARLKQADSWADSQYNDVSDALSAVLELVRQHHVSLKYIAAAGMHCKGAHACLPVLHYGWCLMQSIALCLCRKKSMRKGI